MVVAEQFLNCKICYFCRTNQANKCDELNIFGQRVNGAFSEYMIFPKSAHVLKLPQALDPKLAVLAEPVAVSVRAVLRSGLADAKSEIFEAKVVAIFGLGTIGCGVVGALRYYRPDLTIIGVDQFDPKIKLARSMGVENAFNISDFKDPRELVSRIQKLCGERHGPDVFFECSGAIDSIQFGLDVIRKKGVMVHVGICGKPAILANWDTISAGKELTVIGSNLGHGSWESAFELLIKGFVPASLITHEIPLEEFQAAFELASNPSNSIKVLLSIPSLTRKITPVAAPRVRIPAKEIFKLPGALCLVTGSSRGIGRAIAQRLAEKGCRVILHGTRETSPSSLGEGTTMKDLASSMSKTTGALVDYVVGDLTDEKHVSELQRSVLEQHGPVEILICCAGGNIGSHGVDAGANGGKPNQDDCLNISLDDYRSVMDRNLTTTVLTCKHFVPEMQKAKNGRVVIIGSVAGCSGRSKGSIYAVSKAAVHEYARCLATQLRPDNITVNVVAPGGTLTERFRLNLGKDAEETEQIKKMMRKRENLVGYAREEDTANACLAFCQPEMSFVSGQIVRVDGGDQSFAC